MAEAPTTNPIAELTGQWLVREGYQFVVRELQHARQFRFKDGLILNVFRTGALTWQGLASFDQPRIGRAVQRIKHACWAAMNALRPNERRPQMDARFAAILDAIDRQAEPVNWAARSAPTRPPTSGSSQERRMLPPPKR